MGEGAEGRRNGCYVTSVVFLGLCVLGPVFGSVAAAVMDDDSRSWGEWGVVVVATYTAAFMALMLALSIFAAVLGLLVARDERTLRPSGPDDDL